MSCEAPGVVFLPRKCSFLSCETKLKFRPSTVLFQEGKASVPCLIININVNIKFRAHGTFLSQPSSGTLQIRKKWMAKHFYNVWKI
jgi:hypothetical protein